MTSKITILTAGISLLLLAMIIFTVIHYETLNANEGWGMVDIVFMSGALLSGYFVEIIIRNRVAGTTRRQAIRTLALACYVLIITLFFLS